MVSQEPAGVLPLRGLVLTGSRAFGEGVDYEKICEMRPFPAFYITYTDERNKIQKDTVYYPLILLEEANQLSLWYDRSDDLSYWINKFQYCMFNKHNDFIIRVKKKTII